MIKQDIERLWKANRLDELDFKIAFIDPELEQIDILINNLGLEFIPDLSWVADDHYMLIVYRTLLNNYSVSLGITIDTDHKQISYSFNCSIGIKANPVYLYATTINELINNITNFIKE